jgi:polyisoprenyl-phosphate glycosyltransferase
MTSGSTAPDKGESVSIMADARIGQESLELSVVVPVYGCAGCLEALISRVTAVAATITSAYEIILVDDRSPDGAWEKIEALAAVDRRVRGLRLSRNFGQHSALTAAFAESRGRWTVALDCDLQDAPEDIARLYAKAQEGYDIVLGRRVRRGHSWFRRAGAALYFKMLRAFTKVDINGEYGTYSIVSRPVVEAFLRVPDRARHFIFIITWLGFRRGEIDIEHGTRDAGKSSYTFGKLVRHAIDGIFFQTTVLLRWIVYLGFTVSLAGAGLAIYFICYALIEHPYPGWTSLSVLILLIGGFIILALGVAGLYIGQIFDQVKSRPLYVIDAYTSPVAFGERMEATTD